MQDFVHQPYDKMTPGNDSLGNDSSAENIRKPTCIWGVSENRVPYSGVLIIRILLFRVLY